MSILLKVLKRNYIRSNQSKDLETSLLETHDSEDVAIRYRTAAFSLLLAAMIGALGFWLGRNTFQPLERPAQDWLTEKTINFQSDETFFRTFMYNGTFASAPSEETDPAWDSLFPGRLLAVYRLIGGHTLSSSNADGKGFIKDPAGHLEAVGVSVFHQLHCLDLLRHLYYEGEPGTGVQALTKEVPQNPHHHAKHCFDYLRQALICAADSTLEPGDATTRFVTGAGVVHECRDFDGLSAWTEQRELKTG